MLRSRVHAGVLLALILIVAGTGCSSTDGGGSAQLRVTADFGSEVLARETIPAGPSVLAALQDLTEVRTGFGGGFVEAMYGRASTRDPRADWFYFVDGRLAETGARGRPVPDGGHIWWDHRRWGGPHEVRAVVGAWPAPFAVAGREVDSDPPLARALVEMGAVLADGDSPWRVRVGADADLRRRSDRWREAAADPASTGIAAAISDGMVTILDAGGEMRTAPSARAIAVAVPGGLREEDGLMLVVAGLDDADARAAAARIAADAGVLDGQFAVAFDGAGNPVAAAGRP